MYTISSKKKLSSSEVQKIANALAEKIEGKTNEIKETSFGKTTDDMFERIRKN